MKAIALLSGGLDSTLAIELILRQGIEVEAVNFFSPFCQCNRKKGGCGNEAKKVTDRLGIKLKMFSLGQEYLDIVKDPPHGYGRNLNPCIDCRILMLKKAKEYMRNNGASFVVTGEVLGQRPMSQHRAALRIVERESGLEGLILRPLSAKLLPETIAEKKGWVDRQKLLEMSGRSRKPQMAKAIEFKIGDYPCPAGGCLLTDSGFARRLRDLMDHCEATLDNVQLLKVGRHFRFSKLTKVVVGRDEAENKSLENLRKENDIFFYPAEHKGPMAIARGKPHRKDIAYASRIVARYCDNNTNGKIKIASQRWPDGEMELLQVAPLPEEELQRFRL